MRKVGLERVSAQRRLSRRPEVIRARNKARKLLAEEPGAVAFLAIGTRSCRRLRSWAREELTDQLASEAGIGKLTKRKGYALLRQARDTLIEELIPELVSEGVTEGEARRILLAETWGLLGVPGGGA